jgi:hypothetical protein
VRVRADEDGEDGEAGAQLLLKNGCNGFKGTVERGIVMQPQAVAPVLQEGC